MIEATIKNVYGWHKNQYRGIKGHRVSIIKMAKRVDYEDRFSVVIGMITRCKKNSRIQKERYEGIFLSNVELEDVVVDDYEEDQT